MTGEKPGFFGKLRTQGDFVARRMPAPLRLSLDAWLQAALLRSRQDLGAAWLPAWLASPLWRFVLAPGVGGERACAGVMMPSLDRVNRCFPLVLAAELAGTPSLADCLGAHGAWFAGLEDLALSTLDADFSIDAFDARLLALDGAPRARADERVAARAHDGAAGFSAAWAGLQGASQEAPRVAALNGALPALAHAPLEGRSAWWTDGAPEVAPCLAMCSGLPAPAVFSALLDGAWEARGWRRA
jgi:type VI secretion system protein ImpM